MSAGLSCAMATWYSSGWNTWWLWRSTSVTSTPGLPPSSFAARRPAKPPPTIATCLMAVFSHEPPHEKGSPTHVGLPVSVMPTASEHVAHPELEVILVGVVGISGEETPLVGEAVEALHAQGVLGLAVDIAVLHQAVQLELGREHEAQAAVHTPAVVTAAVGHVLAEERQVGDEVDLVVDAAEVTHAGPVAVVGDAAAGRVAERTDDAPVGLQLVGTVHEHAG